MNQSIDYSGDFIQFQNDVQRKHGLSFGQQASVFFKRALFEYNKGMKNSALETAKLALTQAEFSGEYITVYINGFLAQLYSELEQYETALGFCSQALEDLKSADADYDEDLQYFTALKESIVAEEVK